MCLAVPGRLLERYDQDGVRMGRFDFGGIQREACIEYLPELVTGDFALIHVGFAISLLDEASALQTLLDLEQMSLLDEEKS